MKNKGNKKSEKIIIAIIVGVFILFILISLGKKPQPLTQQYFNKPQIQNDQFKTHTSQDLKISFKYPIGWYVDDRYRMVLITNYKTNLNRDDKPSNNQIEILVDEFSGCHRDIEENLKDPACGEGGLSVAKNEIVSKEVKQTKEGIFYRYIVRTPKGNKLAYYLLEKGDKILQISKQPDPSMFEKEFEEIVNSIRFL